MRDAFEQHGEIIKGEIIEGKINNLFFSSVLYPQIGYVTTRK